MDMKLKPIHQRKGHLSLRLGRCSEHNGVYLITSSTWQRKPIFSEWKYAHAAVRAFTQAEILKDATLLCWTLMPDHAHWLLQLGTERDLSTLVGVMKSSSARAVRRAGHQEQVWVRAYHDRAIRREECIEATARYVVLNPVRAGIVQRVGDYPFWNAIYF